MKDSQGWRALKGLMRKGGAFGQKALSFPFLIPAEQGRRFQGAGGGLRRRPRAWRRPGSGGKGRWAHGRSNPLLNSSGGGPWRWRHGGERQRATASLGRRHGARRRPGSEGKTERGLRRPGCLTWLGLERSGEGCSAMAGVRERRLWRAAALGGNGRWRPGMRGSGAAPSPLL